VSSIALQLNRDGYWSCSNQPQLPPLLRTMAVPPFGVQVGGNESEPSASPPPVAVACTKLPSASQLALTVEPPVAIPVALQFPRAAYHRIQFLPGRVIPFRIAKVSLRADYEVAQPLGQASHGARGAITCTL